MAKIRSDAFKDYVLARAAGRGNPFNFSAAADYNEYLYTDHISSWDYTKILDFEDVNTIVPSEVLWSKVCLALFRGVTRAEDVPYTGEWV